MMISSGMLSLGVVPVRVVLSFAVVAALAAPAVSQEYSQLQIGVRFDAAPFSYRDVDQRSENLEDYKGYVVEVCKEVLKDMILEKPFRNAVISAKEVDTTTRFDELMADGGIDVLCGPASITQDRVASHLVSMPIYLTGVAVAYPRIGETEASSPFPYGSICDRSIVGFVANTTAEYPGVQKMADENRFFRFSQIVSKLLNLTPAPAQTGYPLSVYGDLKGEKMESIDWTEACDTTWTAPPIRAFKDHDTGLKALCDGSVLFYVADVDIISQYLFDHRGNCDATLDRDVAFSEHYGIYFRKPDPASDEDFERSLFLYAAFSRSLVKRVYSGEGVFERAFRTTFGTRERTVSLEQFFRSFSTAQR